MNFFQYESHLIAIITSGLSILVLGGSFFENVILLNRNNINFSNYSKKEKLFNRKKYYYVQIFLLSLLLIASLVIVLQSFQKFIQFYYGGLYAGIMLISAFQIVLYLSILFYDYDLRKFSDYYNQIVKFQESRLLLIKENRDQKKQVEDTMKKDKELSDIMLTNYKVLWNIDRLFEKANTLVDENYKFLNSKNDEIVNGFDLKISKYITNREFISMRFDDPFKNIDVKVIYSVIQNAHLEVNRAYNDYLYLFIEQYSSSNNKQLFDVLTHFLNHQKITRNDTVENVLLLLKSRNDEFRDQVLDLLESAQLITIDLIKNIVIRYDMEFYFRQKTIDNLNHESLYEVLQQVLLSNSRLILTHLLNALDDRAISPMKKVVHVMKSKFSEIFLLENFLDFYKNAHQFYDESNYLEQMSYALVNFYNQKDSFKNQEKVIHNIIYKNAFLENSKLIEDSYLNVIQDHQHTLLQAKKSIQLLMKSNSSHEKFVQTNKIINLYHVYKSTLDFENLDLLSLVICALVLLEEKETNLLTATTDILYSNELFKKIKISKSLLTQVSTCPIAAREIFHKLNSSEKEQKQKVITLLAIIEKQRMTFQRLLNVSKG